MTRALAVTAVLLGGLLPAAHAWRWHGPLAALAWLAPVLSAATGRAYPRLAARATLVLGALDLAHTGAVLVGQRLAAGQPFARLACIMAAAALAPLVGAACLGLSVSARARVKRPAAETSALPPRPFAVPDRPRGEGRAPGSHGGWTGLAACALTLAGLGLALYKGPPGLLAADRFLPEAGRLQAVLLALYAGFVAEALADPARSARVRRAVWTLFSVVFFAQLALGLAGFSRFLLSGALHPPVPALILAGPIFRGEGVFMPVLFAVSALLVGPAWCSHLCYVGAWDSACAGQGAPLPAPAWMRRARAGLAAGVVATALGLRLTGTPVFAAACLALGFGLVGVGVMALVSRRKGYMAHCAGYCPMGLVSGLLGKLSPWRLRIGSGCTACGACSRACRYDALRPEHLAARRPGLSCSLCLDCLAKCPKSHLALTVFGKNRPWTRPAFAVAAATLHAVFLGVARM